MRSLVVPIDLRSSLDRYVEAFPRETGTFLLKNGTLLGAEPFLTFRAWRTPHRTEHGSLSARIEVRGTREISCAVDDPFAVLRQLLVDHAHHTHADRRLPLMSGAVGYIGYEAGQLLEAFDCDPREGDGMPCIAFGFHEWVLGTTPEGALLSIVAENPEAVCARVMDRIRSFESNDVAPAPILPRVPDLDGYEAIAAAAGVTRSAPRKAYLESIAIAKSHIAAGDAYEICLTHGSTAPFRGDPLRLFRALVLASPAPYAAFLDLPEGAIVSSSPEKFVSLDAQRVAESRPIKGTRPRGATPAEDRALAADLAAAEKDRAENAMIVDLVRNDLGRVCEWGSVEVPAFGTVEPYATVHQLVSTVRGKLAPQHSAVDLLQACFPPGSMTGAPKIEAMKILESLEPLERGVYAGALGFIDFDGTMDTSVVIRAAVVREGRATFHVGGAIIADSEPEAEHAETLHKARAMVASIGATA